MQNGVVLICRLKNIQTKKVRQYLLRNGIPFTEQCVKVQPLSYEQFLKMLQVSTYGVEEIISFKSSSAKALKNEGIDMEQMTIKQLYWVVTKFPDVLKNVIVLGEKQMVVGYDENELSCFLPRSWKQKRFRKTLQEVQAWDLEDSISAAD